MAFFDSVFPERISAEASGGPRFFTSKAYTTTGRRLVNRDAAYPLHRYTISHPVRTGQDFEELRAFFYVVGGDTDAFRFKDWSDYRATFENTTMTLVTGAQYQMCRTYRFGNRTFIRPISKPRQGAQIRRTRASVPSDITATSSIDSATGIVTVTGHQAGDTYTWAGDFDVPVAFVEPEAIWRAIGTPKMLTEWPSIELEEVRL